MAFFKDLPVQDFDGTTRNFEQLAQTGLPIAKTKAGTISDADFTLPPPNGTMALDTTNIRLYIRVAGTWRYVVLT